MSIKIEQLHRPASGSRCPCEECCRQWNVLAQLQREREDWWALGTRQSQWDDPTRGVGRQVPGRPDLSALESHPLVFNRWSKEFRA